jgi:hypothetical protein
MRIKRLVVMMIVLAFLTVGTLRPRPAQASTSETVIIIVGSIAAYAAFIILGAYYVYGKAFPSPAAGEDMDMDEGLPGDPPSPTVHFGQHCRQSSTNVTVACW